MHFLVKRSTSAPGVVGTIQCSALCSHGCTRDCDRGGWRHLCPFALPSSWLGCGYLRGEEWSGAGTSGISISSLPAACQHEAICHRAPLGPESSLTPAGTSTGTSRAPGCSMPGLGFRCGPQCLREPTHCKAPISPSRPHPQAQDISADLKPTPI